MSLKPCPLCGKPWGTIVPPAGQYYPWRVYCANRGVHTVEVSALTEAEAIEAWNTRCE